MMNARENLDAVISGNPERYSNNYEALYLKMNPFVLHNPSPKKGGEDVVDAWGVTKSYPANVPGSFPVHTRDKIVIKDFEDWKEYVKFPSLKFPEEEWAMFKEQYDSVDQTQAYCGALVVPGIFERMHHLGGMENTLMGFYECEDEMHELIERLTEWELEQAEGICSHLKPEAILHHDDWGGLKSTFMSPSMFEEFFVDAYKKIYGYYHSHGVKYVFHHADSYCATLVPMMIEMGIDVWQGCLSTNDLPTLVKKYGDKITFMGGFDGGLVDKGDMTKEGVKKIVYDTLDAVGTPKGFIPCIAQGGPGSVFPAVYHWLVEAIDDYNVEKMGVKREDITRLPLQILF